MPTVHEIESALFGLAPRELAMDWDNVGLLLGDPAAEVTHVLLSLDAPCCADLQLLLVKADEGYEVVGIRCAFVNGDVFHFVSSYPCQCRLVFRILR